MDANEGHGFRAPALAAQSSQVSRGRVERLLTESRQSSARKIATGRNGSGCDGQPIGFIAGKPALKVRCP